ncbi:hypothetical protein V8E51_012793 [Hyaloscypha variabilis]
MPRAKRSESEVKEMVCSEILWRKPFYSAYLDDEETVRSNGDDREAELNAGEAIGDPSIPPSNGCPLLDRLVLEVRLIILRQSLVRPVAIVPGPVHYKLSIGWRDKPVLPWYRYQWNDRRQQGFEEYGLPSYNGETQHLQIAWRTKPTVEQHREIEQGNAEGNDLNNELRLLDSTWDSEIQAQVGHYVCQRGEFGPQIINRAVILTSGIQGINLLRTCKQLHKEGTSLLYGENTFVFDTRGKSPYTHHRGIHAHDVFNANTHHIPGYPNPNGRPASRNQIARAIDMMFNKGIFHGSFSYRDPMMVFMRKIGRENASKLTSVKVEGFFRTAENNPRYKSNRPVGLARLLPIYMTILNVCPNLRKLVVHQGHNNALWDDDLDGAMGLNNEERVNVAVEKLVRGLPTLQSLQLGNYHFVPSEDEILEQWGKSLQWEGWVEDRV